MLHILNGDALVYACGFLDASDLSVCACACNEWATVLKRYGNRIHNILWNYLSKGLEPAWAIGRTHQSLNRQYWKLSNSQGRVQYKTEVFDDKITGIHLYENIPEEKSDIWCVADFSGSASLVKIKDGTVLAQQNFYLEDTDFTLAKSSYTCSVLVWFDVETAEREALFLCGTKSGKLIIFSIEHLKGRGHHVSDSHIRSMCTLNASPPTILVGDGSGFVRIVKILKHGMDFGIQVLHTWDLYQYAKLRSAQSRMYIAVTSIRAKDDTVVFCTKKEGVYVFENVGGDPSQWTMITHIGQSLVGERFITSVEFLSENEIVVGTRGASFTGNDSRILQMLKDNCCVAIHLRGENQESSISWSLPIKRTIYSIFPLSPKVVLLSVDYGGLELWDTKKRQRVNSFNPLKSSPGHFANLTPHCSGDSLFATVQGGIFEIRWSSCITKKSQHKKK